MKSKMWNCEKGNKSKSAESDEADIQSDAKSTRCMMRNKAKNMHDARHLLVLKWKIWMMEKLHILAIPLHIFMTLVFIFHSHEDAKYDWLKLVESLVYLTWFILQYNFDVYLLVLLSFYWRADVHDKIHFCV